MDKKEEEEDMSVHMEDGRVLSGKEFLKEIEERWNAMPEEERKKELEEFKRDERLTKLYLKHIEGIRACLKDRIRMLVFERRLPSWENGSEELFEKAIWDYAALKTLKHSETDDLLYFLLARLSSLARDIWENVAYDVEGEEGEEWQKHLERKSSGKIKKERGEYYIPYRTRAGEEEDTE